MANKVQTSAPSSNTSAYEECITIIDHVVNFTGLQKWPFSSMTAYPEHVPALGGLRWALDQVSSLFRHHVASWSSRPALFHAVYQQHEDNHHSVTTMTLCTRAARHAANACTIIRSDPQYWPGSPHRCHNHWLQTTARTATRHNHGIVKGKWDMDHEMWHS